VFDTLIVDDDLHTRMMLRMVLEDDGYAVYECANGECAVALLRTHPQPLIAVLDWLMPGFDGEQVLQTLMQDPPRAYRHAYILVTAGNGNVRPLPSLPPELDVRLVRKPFEVDTLLSEVHAADARLGAGSEHQHN
jgi:CheY-like chemotaxis protein